ncbi:MAG: KEOPS complex subunit Pcc1 [Archaeoglobaceae archaeon]
MLYHARLKIEIRDAEAVARALSVDDPEWCSCRASGDELIVEVTIDRVGALLYALDDYLMHLKMCEGILRCLAGRRR